MNISILTSCITVIPMVIYIGVQNTKQFTSETMD